MSQLVIPQQIYARLVAHALAAAPVEACGILSGRDGVVETFHPMTNADNSSDHFMMVPKEQFAVAKAIRAAGQQMLAIYHSHPASPARPSTEDIRLAATPDVLYVILSLQERQVPVIKGFRIKGEDVTTVPVAVAEKTQEDMVMSAESVFRLPESVKADVRGYRAQMERFQRGEISAVAFRAFRVPMGVYEHRQDGHYMVRVRVGGGMLTSSQLRLLGKLSREHGNGILHVTTRQDVQIHDVSLEGTAAVHEKLLEGGMSARGGGGNTVRNITACPRASVCADAIFDVAPYSVAAAEYLLQSKSAFNLPRKFKVAFSGCKADCAFASVNDVGFFAHIEDGQNGFSVYAGGGLGGAPAAGVLVEPFIRTDEVFEVLEAVKRLFDRTGDRANKHQARLRYVVRRLGAEGFVAEYRKEREQVRQSGLGAALPKIRDVYAPYAAKAKRSSAVLNPVPPGVIPEKQPGLYTLQLALSNGQVPAPEADQIAEVAEQFGVGLLITTQQQDVLIPGISAKNVPKAQQVLKDLSIDVLTPRPKVVACAGASTCKLGLCLSPYLADALEKQFAETLEKGTGAGTTIRISGCPNSCGNHCIASIGLEGKVKRHQGRMIPCYEVLAGGKTAEGGAKLAQRLGTVAAKQIPALLAEAVSKGVTDVEGLRKRVAAKSALPDPVPEDWYIDYGSIAPFTLAGRGPGECGAGVLDVVRVDLDEAQDALRAASATDADAEKSAALYKALAASARALLPIFGIEARKDREAFDAFRERLVLPAWVKPQTNELIAGALDWRLGDRSSLADLSGAIEEVVQRVKSLFSSLDANLQFKLAPLTQETAKAASAPSTSSTAKALDLSGVACPMNFVKAKVALERIPVGETLSVLLDSGDPIRNVPASFSEQGQEVVSIAPEGDRFRLQVRRKK